jgi:hypothetical protein
LEVRSQKSKRKNQKKKASAQYHLTIIAPLLFTTVVQQLNQGTKKGTRSIRSFLDFFPMHRDYFVFIKKKKVTNAYYISSFMQEPTLPLMSRTRWSKVHVLLFFFLDEKETKNQDCIKTAKK